MSKYNRMILSSYFSLFLLIIPLACSAQSKRLYVIAGQSNAVGIGDMHKSVDCSSIPCYEYDIIQDSIIPLKDPVGQNWKLFHQANSGSIGPALAKRMNELSGENIYLVSTARGGASCHRNGWLPPYNTWDERGELFQDAIIKIDAALAKSKASFSGIIWLQGERDANAILDGRMKGLDYKKALKNLIIRFRTKYGKHIPFYIVQTGYQLDRDKDGTLAVREMQNQVAKEMQNVHIVYTETEFFLQRNWYKDRVHYAQEGLNDIGIKTAEYIMNTPNDTTHIKTSYHNRYGWELIKGDSDEFLLKNEMALRELINIESKLDVNVPFYYVPSASSNIENKDFRTVSIVYKKEEKSELKLEIDMPLNKVTASPFILYIHGGGWSSGSLNVFQKHSSYLASHGIAGVRISYSLIGQGATLEKVEDEIAEAWEFIVKNKDTFNLDTDRWGILGASAGAYLGSLAALKLPNCTFFMGFYGSYDLLRTRSANFPSNELCKKFLGEYNEEALRKASPIYRISDNKQLPSFLLLHGTADTSIHYEQSRWFAEELRKNRAEVEEVYYDSYEHAFTNRFFSDIYETILYKICNYSKIQFGIED